MKKNRCRQSDKILSTRTKILGVITVLSLSAVFGTLQATASYTGISFEQNKNLTRQTNDGFKVVATQEAIAAAALAETLVSAKHKLATSENMLMIKNNVTDLYFDFMSETANTSSARCFQVSSRSNDSKVPERTQMFVKADLINNVNSGGFASEDHRIEALNTMKFSIACTMEMAKQGYCTPSVSGGQYFDTDFGMFHSSGRLAETQFLSAKAGVFTIANPTPDPTSLKACSGDTHCVGNLERQNNRLAVNSLVANSLLTQLYNRMTVGSVDENKK